MRMHTPTHSHMHARTWMHSYKHSSTQTHIHTHIIIYKSNNLYYNTNILKMRTHRCDDTYVCVSACVFATVAAISVVLVVFLLPTPKPTDVIKAFVLVGSFY